MGNSYRFVDRMHDVLVAKAGDRLCIKCFKCLNQSALQVSEDNSSSNKTQISPSQAKASGRVHVSHLFFLQPPVSGLIVISSHFPHAK
jgi:hypothetical protein